MDDVHGYVDLAETFEAPAPATAVDGTRLQKFELALKTLGIPLEDSYDFSIYPNANEVNYSSVVQNLSIIDPDSALRQYFELSPNSLSLFKDFFGALLPSSYLEHTQILSTLGQPADSSSLLFRLNQISLQVKSGIERPLTGLRIAIDPGHMGPAAATDPSDGKATTWDDITGKFVKVGNKKVSEGQLNLWTARLIAQELEALGAEVKLTRTKNGTVAPAPENTDLRPHLNQYYYNSLDGWMASYLNFSDDRLVKEIVKSPAVSSIQKPAQQIQQLYISGADLSARTEMINAFNPDITFDVHFDASKSNALQKGTDDIEAYVPGSFRQGETGSRKVRAMATQHLLETRRWHQSVELATEVTQSMSKTLDLPLLSRPSFLSAIKVRDGVYARNLYLTRGSMSGLIVYLECLHYDHVKEHSQLATLDQTKNYKGVVFKYPNRLNQISEGVRTGLLNYFRSL